MNDSDLHRFTSMWIWTFHSSLMDAFIFSFHGLYYPSFFFIYCLRAPPNRNVNFDKELQPKCHMLIMTFNIPPLMECRIWHDVKIYLPLLYFSLPHKIINLTWWVELTSWGYQISHVELSYKLLKSFWHAQI